MFYYSITSLGMKCVFKHQDLKMFGPKLNKYDQSQVSETIFVHNEVLFKMANILCLLVQRMWMCARHLCIVFEIYILQSQYY